MLRVYLDQNKWIDLSRAFEGDELGEHFRDVASMITAAVETGHASFPLSAAHVFETWKKRQAAQRHRLARTMATVSRNHAIASPSQLVPGELDRAFRRRFGRPTTLLPVQPFGWGMRHRSGMDFMEMSDGMRAALVHANPGLTERDVTDWIDAMLLAGPPADLPVAGIAQPPLQFGEDFAKDENEQVQTFIEHGADKDTRRRAVAARMLLNLRDPIHDAQKRAAISTDDLLGLGAEGLTDFMRDLPSQAGVLELTWLQHDNPQTRWYPNDLNDIAYLSAAVGYCDVVVTERKWTHMFTRCGIADRFGTVVMSDLADLTEILVTRSVLS